jgi:hypothetical protein
MSPDAGGDFDHPGSKPEAASGGSNLKGDHYDRSAM